MSKRLLTYDTKDVKNGSLNLKKNGAMDPQGFKPDWSQIENKPFGEQVLMQYTLDENYTETYETAEINEITLYRIPNSSYISMESVEGGTLSLSGQPLSLTKTPTETATLKELRDGAYMMLEGMLVVIPIDNLDLSNMFDSGGYFEHAGVYVADFSALGLPIELPLSIEITKTVPIDDKYLPAKLSFNDSGELVVTIGNTTKTFTPKS